MKSKILNKFRLFLFVFFLFIIIFLFLISLHTRSFIKKNIKDSYIDTTKHISLFITASIKNEINSVIKFIDLSGIKDFVERRDNKSLKRLVNNFIYYKRNVDKNYAIRNITVIKKGEVLYGDIDKEDKIVPNIPIYFSDLIKKDANSYYITVFINRHEISFKVDIYFLELMKLSEISVLSEYSIPILCINVFYIDKLIYSSFPYTIGSPISEFISDRDFSNNIVIKNNRIFISTYQELYNNTMLFFVVEYNYEVLIGYYDKISFAFILITFFIVSMIILLSNKFLKKTFIEPLRIIKRAIENVWENKVIIDLKKFSNRNDEFGLIIRSFINMINEIKESFVKIAESKKRLEDLNREKDEFLAILSHEIKTPLNGILGTSQIFLTYYQDSLTKEIIEGLNIIKDSAERLLRIINTGLTLSEVEIGKVKIEKTLVNIDEIIRYCKGLFDSLKYNYNKNDLEFHVNNSSSFKYIVTDKDKIFQVLNNLINNAVKFTEKGFVSLYIFDGDNRIYFKVSDTGVGIKKEHLGNIFKKFFQPESAFSKSKEGLGLGLYIVKRIVNALEGDINVESEINKGSSFTFYFPVHKAEKIDTEKKAFIMTADDEIDFNYRSFFEANNIKCLSFSDYDFLEKIFYGQPDIILFNICNPVGLKLVKVIEDIKQNIEKKIISIPIIVLKNKTILVLDNTYFLVNDDDFISKIRSMHNYENINKILLFGQDNECYALKEILLSNGFLVHVTDYFDDIYSVKPNVIVIKVRSGNHILSLLHKIKTNKHYYVRRIPIVVSLVWEDFVSKEECERIDIKHELEGYNFSESVEVIRTILDI